MSFETLDLVPDNPIKNYMSSQNHQQVTNEAMCEMHKLKTPNVFRKTIQKNHQVH